jgi:2'-5' RNA ligase
MDLMKNKKSHYLIEIRYFGKAKYQIKELINEVDNKFNLTNMNKVPHITLVQPFTTNKQNYLVSDFHKICSKHNNLKFTVDGIGVFPFFVIFSKVKPSQELLNLREDLIKKIKNYCKITQVNRSFKPHTTIALKMGFFNFFRIWFYLLRKPKLIFTNHVLRVTLLKDKKILYEYDFYNKKLLNRNEALNKSILGNTFKKLKKNEN